MRTRLIVNLWITTIAMIAALALSAATGYAANVDINSDSATNYTGVIQGSDTLTKQGTGTATLTPTFSATGGTVTSYGGDNIHAFTAVGSPTFSTNVAVTAKVLVVAGGGGGGGNYDNGAGSGGGGAGGLVYDPSYAVSAGNTNVTVGSGGAGGTAGASANVAGSPEGVLCLGLILHRAAEAEVLIRPAVA